MAWHGGTGCVHVEGDTAGVGRLNAGYYDAYTATGGYVWIYGNSNLDRFTGMNRLTGKDVGVPPP